MYRFKQFILFAGDIILLFIGFYAALAVRYFEIPTNRLVTLTPSFIILFFGAALLLFIAGLYDVNRAKNSWTFFQKLAIVAILWIVVGIIYFYLFPTNFLTPKTILLLTSVSGFGLVAIWRYLHNRFVSAVILRSNVVFAGVTPEVEELVRLFRKESQRGFTVSGIIHVGDIPNISPALADLPIAPTLKELENNRHVSKVQLIVIAPELTKNNVLLAELYANLYRQVEVVDLAYFYEEILGRIPPFTFADAWFLTNLREHQKKIYDRIRILLDYTLALVMAIFFLITLPFVALLIKINSPGLIFFKQKRIGRAGRPFTIYKFRTMHSLSADGSAEVDGPEFAKINDSRITAVGKFLRRVRLDEVPQFINILQGNMGIVGPRPERPEFVKELTDRMPPYALRHLIKPGITGWAQLHSSYYGTIDENLAKLEYDLYYIKNRGFILDCIILLRTIGILGSLAGR